MTSLQIEQLSLSVDDKRILNDIDLTISTGELVVILGSNGAGKSSLMKGALGLTKAVTGSIQVNGTATQALTNLERARLMSYLPQVRPVAWPVLVKHVVALGRFAYGATMSKLSGEDAAAVENALKQCDLTDFADRRIDSLSGGEMTRVHCARAFAAAAPLLLADEPTTALDPRHQLETMQLLREYIDTKHGALVILHEPELAARFADRIVWMKNGQIVADGTPADTLDAAMLERVYGVEAVVTTENQRPSIDLIRPI